MRAVWLGVMVSALLALFGCGHSEDEWQAQLAKYRQLNGAYDNEKKQRAAVQAELDDTKKKVADLTQKLQEMGLNLDTLNQQLQQTGSEKQ